MFKRFDVLWTPTTLIFDPDGKERFRLEGYLPKPEFSAEIMLGRGRVAFMEKKWDEAERIFEDVVSKFPDSNAAAAATYWAGVARYKRTNDHHELGKIAGRFRQQYQGSEWAKKASVWAH